MIVLVLVGAPIGVALIVWNLLMVFLRTPRLAAAGEIATGVFALVLWLPGALHMARDGAHWSTPLVEYADTGVQGFHEPFASEHSWSLAALAVVGAAGYLVVRAGLATDLPPLVTVLSLAALYLGCGVAVVALLQLLGGVLTSVDATLLAAYAATLPVSFLLCSARLVRATVERLAVARRSHAAAGDPDTVAGQVPDRGRGFAGWCRRALDRGRLLPWYAAAVLLPVLGVLAAVLALLGPAPDVAVRAVTDTAGWTFSQRIPPPMIQRQDGHYLCTVAATGTPAVVKPLRTGRRHGHPIIVNRQLCVANAFEDLLAERLPRLHRGVRAAYDRWGYPLSVHITTARAADLTYRLMKPAEWVFLAILYLCDAHPERRIARQYPDTAVPAAPSPRSGPDQEDT